MTNFSQKNKEYRIPDQSKEEVKIKEKIQKGKKLERIWIECTFFKNNPDDSLGDR